MRDAVRLVVALGGLLIGTPLPATAQQSVVLPVPRQTERTQGATDDANLLAVFDTTRVPVDTSTHRIIYAGAVSVGGASAAEVYERARWWFASTFRCDMPAQWLDSHAGNRMQLNVCYQHPTETRLLGWEIRHTFPVYGTMQLRFRDGQCEYVVTDLHTLVITDGAPFRTDVEVWYARSRSRTRKPKARAAAVRSVLAFDAGARELIASLREGLASTISLPAEQ